MAKSGPRAAEPEGDSWALWNAVRSGDAEARRKLFDTYSTLTRRLAAQLYAGRSDDAVDFDDYLHYGMVGLLEAVDRFDPGRGASFPTFARYRIRGAILNGIDKASERREFFSHERRLRAERIRSLRKEGFDSSAETFRKLVDVTIGVSLGLLLETSIEEEQEAKVDRRNPYASWAVEQARRQVGQAVEKLPDSEQFIVRQHYFHHMSFADIASLLGVTRGRVSQLHGRALGRIREAYEAGRPLDSYY